MSGIGYKEFDVKYFDEVSIGKFDYFSPVIDEVYIVHFEKLVFGDPIVCDDNSDHIKDEVAAILNREIDKRKLRWR